MAKVVFLLFLTVFSIWCLEDAAALSCYKCSSLAGLSQACEVDPTTGENETCAEGQTQCVTLKRGGLYRPSSLSRHCAPAGFCDTMSVGANVHNRVESCQTCDTDLCNSA